MSDPFSNSFGGGSQLDAQEEQKPSCIYGMYFCGACNNLMTPQKDAGEKLQFFCKQCEKKQVDFSNFKDQQCIIYNKQLKPGSRKDVASKQYVFDLTMPRVQIQCPQCGCQQAIFFITPDEGQTCLQLKLICENVVRGRCDYDWVMNAEDALYKNSTVPTFSLEDGK